MAKRGPRTEAGRRKSALNAVSHGVLARTPVIPGLEVEAEWTRHLTGFQESLAPATPFEAFLVERIAQTGWRLKRLELYENEMLFLAQVNAEEAAAARILHPGGGAISLHGASAASLIRDRIQLLRRLADLLLQLQSRAAARPPLSREEGELLYEGLNLILARSGAVSDPLRRRVVEDLTTDPPGDTDKVRDLARNVLGLLQELEEIVQNDQASAAARLALLDAPSSRIASRYPVELVLVTLLPEIRRLENEQPDLEATIARLRRESLLLDGAELAKVTRYEAHLRRQFVQYLHELQALSS